MRTKTACVLLVISMTAATAVMAAQGPPPPPVKAEEPSFDPLRANKDIEVGTFYLNKGNYDAAIDRFEEAARLQPGLAAPYLKLGQTYEKKNDLPSAVTAYRKYLDLYRTSPDAKKMQKHIADLEKQIAREAAKPAAAVH